MALTSTKPYRKLPGSGGSLFHRHNLWLGSDHVLSVASSAVGERYRRFYFADIQAFVWRRSLTLWIRLALWLCIGGLFALGLLSPERDARIGLGIVAGLFVVFAIIDAAFGATCTCYVKTAVQFEPLPSLGRVRTVRKILAQVTPLIAQAQAPAAEPAAETPAAS